MPQFKIKLIKSAFLHESETRRKLADFILTTELFSMSKECKKFEEAFAKKQERTYALFVNSGSSANLILIQALMNLGRLKRGDCVGVSAITWSTNVSPLLALGLVPVAIDCELSSLNVSSRELQKHIDTLQALFITNALGFCHDISNIRDLCAQKKVIFIEDNCEALGSRASASLLGNFGVAATFSFFLGHHLSSLEGGMVVTDDKELYYAMVVARSHGWDRNLPEDKRNELRAEYSIDPFYALYTFYDIGHNVRPTEVNGFLGNSQIEYWDALVKKREENFHLFEEAMRKNSDFLPIDVSHMDIVSNFAMSVITKDQETFVYYRKKFQNNGVEIRPIIAGDITQQPFYKKYIKESSSCPNASLIHRQGFYFGNDFELSVEEISFLCGLLATH